MDATQIQGNIKQIDNYILEMELGQGQFGTVFKARNVATDSYYAIKRIEKRKINSNPLLGKLLQSEIKIMQEIEHPNILHLYEYIESKQHYYLVLNYCDQGDMENYMKTRELKYFEEAEALNLLQQIMNGFYELRKKKILHRDFKLANIFMSESVLVIGDFGLAKYGFEQASTILGTPQTMAPEILWPNMEQTLIYTSKSDIWSIGVVYYQLLFGAPPYTGLDRGGLYRSMKEKTGEKTHFMREISEESKDILKKMLTMDPNERIGWKELFEHPVFNKEVKQPDNLMNGMTKIMQTMVPSSDMNFKNPRQQFQNNKQDLTMVDKMEMIDPEAIETIQNVRPKESEEHRIDPAMEKKILDEMSLKEISYTYNHERNKLFFQIFTVKHLQWSLKNTNFAFYADAFFQISLLLLKKAIVLNAGLIGNLQTKMNIFRIDDKYWDMFTKSESFQKSIDMFINLKPLLDDYFNLVKKRTQENGLNSEYFSHLLNNPNPNLIQVDQAMTAQLHQISNIRNMDPQNMNAVHQTSMNSFIKLIETSINSESTLKYTVGTGSDKVKFKIDEFYQKIAGNLGTPFYE